MLSFFCKRPTEAGRIERIRRNIRAMDRMRPWLIAFHVLAAIVLVVMSIAIAKKFDALLWANNPGPAQIGVLVGLAYGMGIGILALKLGHGLGWALFGYRNERLLLRYYDAFQAIARVEINAPPVGGDESRR